MQLGSTCSCKTVSRSDTCCDETLCFGAWQVGQRRVRGMPTHRRSGAAGPDLCARPAPVFGLLLTLRAVSSHTDPPRTVQTQGPTQTITVSSSAVASAKLAVAVLARPYMARRHGSSAAPATTRSLSLRVLSTLALILPAILLIISFSLALTTIYSPKWAVQDIFDQNGNRTRFHNYRAPFYQCNQTDVITDDIEKSGPNTTCTRIHGIGIGLRGMDFCEQLDPKDDHLCQQTVMSANLMVAGVVFIAVAMAISFAVLGTGVKAAIAAKTTPLTTQEKDGQHEVAAAVDSVSWTSGLDVTQLFLSLTGSGMLLLAQIVGVNALVNDALPNANFEEFQANTPGNSLSFTSWYLGKASYVFISVAWLAGFLASFISRFNV
jgi:hypothetical protein